MSSFGRGHVETARQAQSIAQDEADPATFRAHVPAGIASFDSAARDDYAAEQAATEVIADRS